MSKQPHIIYILSDEHYAGAMSHRGDPNIKTPFMDQMAEEGVAFNNAFSNCPVCTPARGIIFSGRHAHCGAVQNFFDVYKASAPSMATILKDAGYHTAYFGKWHCGVVLDQLPSAFWCDTEDHFNKYAWRTPEYHRGGFEDWYAFEANDKQFKGWYWDQHDREPKKMTEFQTDWLTRLATDYINDYDGDKPLFLVLSIEPPHFPLDPPEENKRWNPDDLIVRENFVEKDDARERLANYYGLIENLDTNLGKFMNVLKANERFGDNTLSIYFSDHGEFMGSHGLWELKSHPNEESVRIPAIFHWPEELAPQKPREELFSLVDLMPTILGAAGVAIPNYCQGMDFSPALRGEAFEGPEEVFLEMHGGPRWNLDFLDWRGYRTDTWKYSYYETGHELMFNLEEDPYELNDLSKADPERCQAMKERLLEILDETEDNYYKIIIEHGVPCASPTFNISALTSGISPAWQDTIVQLPDPP
ncbi:MAG: sulfatase-like hydrolase/transferase [Lentisphaeria bacterium]|nr:sulfatase-like hydrolase/transferase [Lentisphaeria bacterium]NQZ70196.1 sulfatase-like hydrolase/transferase [Lentisphaeria bacterium]